MKAGQRRVPRWFKYAKPDCWLRPLNRRTVIPNDIKKFGKRARVHPYTPGRLIKKHDGGRVTVVFGENLLGGPMEVTMYALALEPVT